MNIGTYTLKQLKEKYNTPLYVYDENIIISNINIFKDNFKSEMFKTNIIYAGKAFLTKYMAKLVNEHNLYLDCVSNGELYTAKKTSFDFTKVFLHGNNKSLEELNFAASLNVGTIVLDNLYEAKMLLNIRDLNYKPNVMLRVNLSINADTHKYIKTSQQNSKFGVSINDESINMIKKLIESDKINFTGLHSHIGSQILDEVYFLNHIDVMLNLYHKLKVKHDVNLTHLNLGGGFGIKYTKEDKDLNIKKLLKNMILKLEEGINKYNLNIKEVYIEPGRSIIGNAGYTLYTINQIKKTNDINYLFVDGSMNDNIRTSLYDANYEAILSPSSKNDKVTYKVVGKACEEGDILIHNITLNKPNINDLLLVKSTGAYHYSMASNYNKIPVPKVIFIKDEEIKVVVRRQTLDDLIKYEL